ncbi:serine hydrolase domain-containing protein [Hyphococcus sp.]|uniref:serine hydrolase domain-containing protein n=1 Tax=Hyphococcus sp. TaxID=2038636 RepID=UPI003CCBFC3D
MIRRILQFILATASGGLFSGPVMGQDASPTIPVETGALSTPAAASYSSAEFEAFVDGAVANAMHETHTVGLTLSVVRDGETKLVKGYGYADLESKTPVDPELHTFRIGSVTKTLTYILAMQLVEDGRLDLDADVNDYLTAFKIPDTFDEPVRVRDLLSHRSGFDIVLRDLFIETGEPLPSLEQWLKDNIPARVRAPGDVSNYDNYGVALLGYIVQEVSGVLYEDYLEQEILTPLQMNSSTARQVLPEDNPQAMTAEQAANAATTYYWKRGEHHEWPFELVSPAPAGSMSSTALDMERYMRAWLNGTELDGARLLEPETARAMRERLYPGRPGADFAHGFRNGKFAGYDTFEHSGATQTSFTTMIMIPELEIGVFASVNGNNGSQTQAQIVDRILDVMIGDARKAPPATIALDNAEAFTGSYLTTRRSHKNAMKIFSLVGGNASVAATDDGMLLVSAGNEAVKYRRVGERSFQEVDGDDVIVFDLDDDGAALRFHVPYGHVAAERTPGDSNAQIFFLAAGLAAFLSLTQLISAWKRTVAPRAGNAWTLGLSAASIGASLLVFAVLSYLGLTLVGLDNLGNEALFRWPTPTAKVLMIGVATLAGLTAILIAGLYPAVAKAEFSIWRKTHYALFVAALVYFVLQLNNWNLLGFKYW